MSYRDLFLKAQKNKAAPYKMFVLDLKGSKNFSGIERAKQRNSMLQTMNLMTKQLLELEKETGQPILLKDKNIAIRLDQFDPKTEINKTFSYRNNPCLLSGDSYNFYFYNNLITEELFLSIFYNYSLKTNNHYTYHFSSGNFETTNYEEGNKLYYLGYCVKELANNKNYIKKDVSLQDYLANNATKEK